MGQKIENTEKNYYTMKQSWFKKFGIIYLPVSIIGYLFYFLTVLFCITVFTAIDRNSHSNSDTLYGVFSLCNFGFYCIILDCIQHLRRETGSGIKILKFLNVDFKDVLIGNGINSFIFFRSDFECTCKISERR